MRFPYVCTEPVLVKWCIFSMKWRKRWMRFLTLQSELRTMNIKTGKEPTTDVSSATRASVEYAFAGKSFSRSASTCWPACGIPHEHLVSTVFQLNATNRACLGKMFVFISKWLKKTVYKHKTIICQDGLGMRTHASCKLEEKQKSCNCKLGGGPAP